MFSGSSSTTPLGGACTPGHTGSLRWHMLQRVRIALCAALMSTRSARGATSAGPAPDSHATAIIPAAATPHVHQGLPLPSCRELKKWRMMGPIASTIATISQLKRVANINGEGLAVTRKIARTGGELLWTQS